MPNLKNGNSYRKNINTKKVVVILLLEILPGTIAVKTIMFYLYELPIPKASVAIKKEIVSKAFTLLCNKSDKTLYEDLRNELGIDKKLVDSYKSADTHNQLRATLEILIAKELYGLNKEDWQFLTATFVYGENAVTRTELKEIIRVSNELF